MVRQLGQGLCGRDPDAAGNADPLVDASANLPSSLDQITSHTMQPDERLVDAVDLLRGPQSRSQAHHAVAHVAVEREVGRQGNQPGLLLKVPDLEPRLAHLDAERLGLIGACNGTPIVVSE